MAVENDVMNQIVKQVLKAKLINVKDTAVENGVTSQIVKQLLKAKLINV